MANSTHKCEVVPIVLKPHSGADLLSVVENHGYTICVRTEDWQGIEKGIHVLPDSLVDTRRTEFKFLGKPDQKDPWERIKARKLRGIPSYGVLIPAPDSAIIGEDYAQRLDVKHYEPPAVHVQGPGGVKLGGQAASPPSCYFQYYDLESFQRYAKEVFVPGEIVVIREKIEGTSSRYVWNEGKLHCGSHGVWKKQFDELNVNQDELIAKVGEERANEIISRYKDRQPTECLWWRVARENPCIQQLCEALPNHVLYGEVYGQVGGFRYGIPPGQVQFAAFDILSPSGWLSPLEFKNVCYQYNVPIAPLVANMPFNFDKICALAELPSQINGETSEGVVVEPEQIRHHEKIGRVKLKLKSLAYFAKKGK